MKGVFVFLFISVFVVLLSGFGDDKYIFYGRIVGIYSENNFVKIVPLNRKYSLKIGDVVGIYRNNGRFLRNGVVLYRLNGSYIVYLDSLEFLRMGFIVKVVNPKYIPPDYSYPEKPVKKISKLKRAIYSFRDGKEMVLIPKGYFYMGANDGKRDEFPMHLVFVGDFYIDRYEVSNYQYKRFIDSTGYRSPVSWKGRTYPKGKGNLPVYPVSYTDALNFCKWAGKRLPKEKEWEKAARGSGIKYEVDKTGKLVRKPFVVRFPWGNDFSPLKANSVEYWKIQGKEPSPTPIYSFVGGVKEWIYKTSNGIFKERIFNLSGNVWEWTSTWYDRYPGNTYDIEDFGKRYKVIRGGAFFLDKDSLIVTRRFYGGNPTLDKDFIAGFRCAISAEDVEQNIDYSKFSEILEKEVKE